MADHLELKLREIVDSFLVDILWSCPNERYLVHVTSC